MVLMNPIMIRDHPSRPRFACLLPSEGRVKMFLGPSLSYARPMYRFTIRDLLWLMALVAVACAQMVNLRQATAVAQRWSDAACKEIAKIGPPLMGRKSLRGDR